MGREGSGTRKTRQRFPVGLLGMVVLVWSIESFLARNPVEFADFMSLSWSASAQAANTTRADVICLGDSLAKFGFVPSVIQKHTGRAATNLAVMGGQAPSSYFLLKRVIEAGSRPVAVIVDFHPNLLASSPRSNGPYWADLVSLRDALDLAWQTRDLDLMRQVVLACAFPSIKGRSELRASVALSIWGLPNEERDERLALTRNWRSNAGAQVSFRPRVARPFGEFSHGSNSTGRWSPSRANVTYVSKLLELASEHGVRVYWVLPPTTGSWFARRERLSLESQYDDFVHKFTVKHRNLVVIDGRRAGYPDSVFLDPTHLNQHGAVALSAALTTQLSENPRSRGWRELPVYRHTPEHFPSETMEQSRLAVSGASSRRG
jgi:hypothetical protein